MKFDFEAARSAGYSDDEIADYLAKENNFDLEGALKSGYSATDVVDFLVAPKGGKQELPSDITPSEGRSATPMGKADPRIVQPQDNRGIIQRVGDYLKPEYKSVMEGYQPTPEQKQAELDKRLSYGAGPISSQAAAAADLVRSGVAKSEDKTVNKVAKEMDRRGERGFGDLVTAAKNETNIKAARDAKAEEWRSAGEWAADTLSSLASGVTTLVQLPTNIVAPSSSLAESLRETQKELQAQESGVLQAQREKLRERVQAEDGFLDKYTATVVNLVTNPALGLSEAVKQVPMFLGVVGGARLAGGAVGLASNASPTLALSEALTGGAIRAGATTAGGAGASMVMAGGDAAGGVYEKLTDPKQTPLSVWKDNPDFQKLKAEGKSDREAIEEVATAKARMAAMVTAPLGLLGFMGAESAVASRGLGKATADALTFGGAGKLFAKDLVGEQLEEGGTQFGGNVVARTVDPNQKLSEGVPEAMGTALVTSAPFSAVGARSQYLEARDAQQPGVGVADDIARNLLDVNSYDPTLISPTQTSKIANFTPAGSPTQQAGLVDIEVPIPNEPDTGVLDVSTGSATTSKPAAGGVAGGNQLGGGVDLPGLVDVGAAGQLGGGARLSAANDEQVVATGDAARQRAPAVGLPRPLERATDADLLGRTEAAIADQQNNNAVVEPVEQWFGRRGDGYKTEGDAQQALPGRQRMFPDLQWGIEQMPGGNYRLAGYSKETQLGTQTTQAQQTETQVTGPTGQGLGSQVAPRGEPQAIGGAEAGAPVMAGEPGAGPRQPGALATREGAQAAGLTTALRLAPPAPLRTVGKVLTAFNKETGINVEMDDAPMTEGQQAASAIARILGKTVTYLKADKPGALPNGFVVPAVSTKDIFIAHDSEDAPLSVVMHEAYHTLPEDKRKVLNEKLLELFNEDKRGEFAVKFNYDVNNKALVDEEIPAFMVQAISKRPDFWNELRAKLGDGDFVDVAKVILDKLSSIIAGARKDYGDEFVTKYIKDVERARDLLSTAYAEAIGAKQGAATQSEAVAASNRTNIGTALQERVDNDFDALVQEYSALKGTEGGRILDTDIARELSPEYRADRSRAAELHDAASGFIQKLFETRMAQSHDGEYVAFMAGGGGSGKSSAQSLLGEEFSGAATVLDGTLSSEDKARRNIQMVIDSGRAAVVMYVYREPVEALRNGVLTRAMRGGRTVPVRALVKGHAGSSQVVRNLAKDYANNPDVTIRVVDNSRGAGNITKSDLANITPVIQSGLKERLIDATTEEFQSGRISETVYRATVNEADAGAAAQVSREDAQGSQGNRREAGAGREAEQARDAVTPVKKEELVDNGIKFSSRYRNLAELPTVDFNKLVNKKVFGIKADLTDAGVSYTGIDGSQLEFPIEMMGGPNFVALPENVASNVVWAVRGGATLTKILNAVKNSDYVLVHAMNGNSHLTNATVSQAYIQTVEAYLRDNRISPENLLALDEMVRDPANKVSLPDFPGFESPNILEYIDGLSFDQRGDLAKKILEKKEAQAHGLPNLARFRRETIDPEYAGYRQGDAMLVLQIDKKNPTVKLGEEGTKMHPSYPLGLRGKVIGKLSKGVNYETIFRDFFENKVPTLVRGEQDAWYTFDRAMPIQTITKEIANSVSKGGYKAIKSARQAEASLAMANNNWLVSGKTKAQGGVSIQEFVDALASNEGAAALTMYSAKEVKDSVKAGDFTVYQLGNQGGDRGLQVFFGLKRGAPWYKGMVDGVGDNEVEVVSVTNNETGAPGVGIPAIITKAISEGATVLDAFAVKSKRFPNGFLPEMYSQFGFEEIGRVAFDSSFYDANKMADLKAFWSKGGWSEADGYPDVVVMRWKGKDEDRATAIERYVRSGETSVSTGAPRYTRASAGEPNQQRDSSRGAKGRSRLGDAGQAGGNQGASDAAPVVRRAFDSIQELATLSDGDIRNLGLNPSEVERLQSALAGGVQRSNRLAEPARGPSAGSDESTRPGTVTGIHYGKAKGLSTLSGTAFGTGIKGAEQARLNEPGVDPRIKKRVYFYLTNNNADMPRPEIGLGQHVYRATLGRMFDMSAASQADKQRVQSLRKTPDANGFESAILDAGFRGYVNRDQGTAVVLNADVPVAYEGMAEASKMRDRIITRTQAATQTRTEGDSLVRKPTSEEMVGIIKARPELAKVAPSFKLEFGEARVKASEAEAADTALADAGSEFRFARVMASNRVNLAEDLAKQEEFLQAKAEEAGYKTIDEFVDNDYEGFVKAGAEWREENPADVMMANRVVKRQRLVGTTFEMDQSSNVDVARIKLQDDALRMKRVIEAVKAKGGNVGEAQNFYDANTLMPGRIQAAIDDFKSDVIKPMLDKAAEYGIDMDELSMYAYAKHAKERNAYIASINKRLPDGGSGMTNAEADTIIQLVDLAGDTAKFDELHQTLMDVTSATRQLMLAEGLISQDEFNSLDGAYDNYIPLRGFENVDEETGVARPGIGRGVNIRGAETVRAMGRKSKAGDLIENVIRDYERVIGRVEKNDVGKVLLDFVLSNPDKDLWGVDVERSKPGFNKTQGTVQYTKSIEKGEDTIGVKVGGQQVYIKFADKELARALRQAWKDETSGLERATLAMTGWWNNWMRAVLTKYNPAFALINIPRDALWSGTASALAELGSKGLARYLAAYPKAFMASARQEAGASGTANALFGNQQVDRQFKEFRAAGGITGGFYMRSLEDINQELRNDLLMAGAAARNPWEAVKSLPPFKAAKLVLKMLEFMGAASENATRFALYQASRESGRSPAQSAILAKDGTTNFNRKGEYGGALNNLYLFFNAAVQGNAQLFKVLKSPAVQASMAGVTGVGMMLALYGASAGGEDDDGEAYWDKVPGYIKERNIVIMLPPGDALAGGIERVGKRGRYVTIPVQYGFNMFPNLGYTMADVLRNQQDPKRGMTPTKAALHMTSTILGSVNPFGGAVDVSDGVQVLLAVMPTLADLPIQLVNERGTFGTPSSPTKSPFDKRPDSERMFISQQGSVSAKIATALNELGGGNEAKAGSLMGVETAVTPGTIQTLISATTGGLGTFVEQVATSVIAMTGNEENLKANKIPFLNKFYGEVDEGANIRTAGERMREVRALSEEVKAQQKLGLDPELKDKEERLIRLASMQQTYDRQSTLIRKREIEIIKSKDMSDAQKTLERKQLQVERDKLATEMNREYLRVVPK